MDPAAAGETRWRLSLGVVSIAAFSAGGLLASCRLLSAREYLLIAALSVLFLWQSLSGRRPGARV